MAAGSARPIGDDDGTDVGTRALVPVEDPVTAVPDGDVDTDRPLSHPSSPADRRGTDGPADAATTARALGLCIVEVLTGGREVDSIARWVTEDVHRHLLRRAALAARARSIGTRSRARPLLQVGSVRVCEPARGIVEAAVVVHTRSHARAVALRLELRQGRWRATAVGVL